MSINKAFSEPWQGMVWGEERFMGPEWGSHRKTPTAGESAACPTVLGTKISTECWLLPPLLTVPKE